MQWQRKVGDGLGKKYIRLVPSVVADRIIAADVMVHWRRLIGYRQAYLAATVRCGRALWIWRAAPA